MLCYADHEWAESVTGKSHQDPERRDDDDDDEGDDEDDDGDGRRNSMSGKPQGSVPGLLDFEKKPRQISRTLHWLIELSRGIRLLQFLDLAFSKFSTTEAKITPKKMKI